MYQYFIANAEALLRSPSSKYSSKKNHLTAKVNSSKKRKYLKDLDKEGARIDQHIVSSLRQPKTMSSLATRNMNSNDSSKHIIAGKKIRNADVLSTASALINQSTDSPD